MLNSKNRLDLVSINKTENECLFISVIRKIPILDRTKLARCERIAAADGFVVVCRTDVVPDRLEAVITKFPREAESDDPNAGAEGDDELLYLARSLVVERLGRSH